MKKDNTIFIAILGLSVFFLIATVIYSVREFQKETLLSSRPKISLEKIKTSDLSLHEAMYYQKLPGKRVKCLLDPLECELAEFERGICRVKVNIGGELKSLVYGKAASVHIDPIEKKPLFHVLPGTATFSIATAGCNLGCTFCQNWQLSQSNPEDIPHYNLSPQEVVNLAIQNRCDSIAYTYSEPVIFYEYMLDTAKLAKEKGLKNLMITAAYINPEPLRELCKYIDAANVDLKGFSEEYYRQVVFGDLETVLNSLKIMQEEGVWIEITNLIVPTLNDDPGLIRQMCVWIRKNLGSDVPLHFSRFHPMYKLKNLPSTPVKTLEEAKRIALEEGLHYVYIGNVYGHFGENTVCPIEGRVLVNRIGYNVIEYNIVEGRCKFCGEKVPGIWQKD
jgi:pyruvate formate lyase activating enzyme